MIELIQIASYAELASKNYSNAGICSACGGNCCKSFPGSAWPEQFGAPDRQVMKERITTALSSGKWAVDRWDPDGYANLVTGQYLRPAMAYELHPTIRQLFPDAEPTPLVDRIVDYSFGGHPCIMLTDAGCSLEEADRPLGCRLLVPIETNKCTYRDLSGNGKLNAAEVWNPYHDVITEVLSVLRP